MTTIFTFLPIIVFGLALLLYLGNGGGNWSWTSLQHVLFPTNQSFAGFGLWGLVALVFANGIWQFIDISSLQRLQSLDKEEVAKHKSHVVRTLRVTGVEAGTGWFLIILTAVTLRAAGLTNDDFISKIASGHQGVFVLLVPTFVFSVVVYMLSTISGFISALSYIAYFDIVPRLTGHSETDTELPRRLHVARFTTIFMIAVIFVLYLLLRLIVPGGEISGVLYAIYAFQIVIMPSALIAVFAPQWKVEPIAAIASVSFGIVVAYLTAVAPDGWKFATGIGMNSDSWQVMPPFASAIVAGCVYLGATLLITQVRAFRAKALGT